MGFAKKKLFGVIPSHVSKLQQLVEQGVLLEIDLAYAQLQNPNGSESEIATHAALLAALRQGHLCVTKNIVDPFLAELVQEKSALPKYAYFEDQIVYHIKRLLNQPSKSISTYQSSNASPEQNTAIKKALTHPLSLIIGGPGTGKTFTAAQVVEAFQTETILAAPTGKAASHLENKVKSETLCGTLHSFLGVRSPLDYLKKPDPLDVKLVIVDECSMIDPLLFARLLEAIENETTLVLMGDQNQLPAVEGGSVFADLIDSKKIPTTCLTKCMRSDRTEILDLADAVLNNAMREIRNIDLGFSENSLNLEKVYTQLWSHVKNQNFEQFRILSTLRKGPLGVDALNAFLFEKFSKQTSRFPIVIKRNDARTGLSNGEEGILEEKLATFPKERQFSIRELPPFEYAYCLSVHKSQGSEYDHVLFLVPNGSEAFGREVLYTAITRARKILEIDGNSSGILSALQRSSRKISRIQEKMTD